MKKPLCSIFQEKGEKETLFAPHHAGFKTHLERLGYSKSSQRMLPACVAEFLDCLEQKGINEPRQIESAHIQQQYEYLSQRPNKKKPGGLSSRMIAHNMYSIRLFMNYLEQSGIITENPISGLLFPRPESKPREVLTIQEVKQLYAATNTYREKAIIGIFFGCGLRRSEGIALNVKDICFGSSLLYVREGKGQKRRVVPINEKVLDDFKNYLHIERWTKMNETAFICNKNGIRTSGNNYNKTIKLLLQKAEINKKISLHNLRHSIATQLLENGLSVEYVRDFLGHKYLEATQIYTRISNRKLREL
jgi:integrase/recombinase XerD